MNRDVQSLYEKIIKRLIKHEMTITAMESCTGGQIASLITNVEGASQIIGNSFVTYTNEAKIKMGVDRTVIDTYGVYSPQTARAMAFAAGEIAKSNISIGVTGTLGRVDPSNPDAPEDKVYYCVFACKDGNVYTREGDITFNAKKPREELKLIVAEKIAYLIQDILLTREEE